MSQLRQDCVQQRSTHYFLRSKTVAIQGNVEHIVRCMFVLDGFVGTLVLVPLDSCSRFINEIRNDVTLDAVVVDESADRSTWPNLLICTLPVVSHEEVSSPLDKDISTSLENDVNTEWLISTSGTTGISKMVKHSLHSLCRTVVLKKIKNTCTWGLLYDPARFAGIQVILHAMIGGASLVISDANESLVERVDQLFQQGVTALSGTPTMWRRLLMIEKTANLKLRQITLGGEISNRQLLNSLTEIFPETNITHIYASTEAGVGFSVQDRKEGFPSSWINKSIEGVSLGISNKSTLMIQSLDTVQNYVNRDDDIFDKMGWHDTGDLVDVIGERVVFRGRINGSINVGGNKVMPEEVERHIEKLDFVSKSVVRARKSSIVGNLLEVSIVLTVNKMDVMDTKEIVNTVRTHCVVHLPAYKVPSFVKVVKELPMTTSGKLKRG